MAKYSDNYGLILPEAEDYYDVAVFNENFKKVDNIVAATGNETIVIASYDTKSTRKQRADYTCTSTDACQVIQQAINNMASGDELLLLDGTYNIRADGSNGIEVNKTITIKGRGINNTIIVQAESGDTENYSGETTPVLNITANDVVIENLMISDNLNLSSPKNMVLVAADGVMFKNVFFVQRMDTIDTYYIIKSTGSCRYSRIQNCRVFRQYSKNELIMFDFGSYEFSGIILGNMLSGADNLSFNFKDSSSRENAVIYGNGNTDIYVNGVKE